ncbi:Putative membrane protein [hydrothermal vent metagenome]|uniref:Putative membrane protein n=1 Tax=hydrothermal vent metagenome TaxID=652676 RepID=A0A1W1D4M2_9ZZZZ
MKYSYVKPRKKTILTPELKLLLSFFSITISMLVLTYLFLLYKDYTFSQDTLTKMEQKNSYDTKIARMKEQIASIESQVALAEKIYTKNNVLKDSISNLFDLIPRRIVLSKAELLENGLILYGVTPNKEIYNFMLKAPLSSIFHKTYSSFYPIKGGWYRFVSTNYIDTKKGEDDENVY